MEDKMKLLSKAFAGRRDRRGNAGGFYSRCVRNPCLLRKCLLAHPRDICLPPTRGSWSTTTTGIGVRGTDSCSASLRAAAVGAATAGENG